MKKIVFLVLFSLSTQAFPTESISYPNLEEVLIGVPFGHPQANKNPDSNRPTTQYRVPNYGVTSEFFPEYQIIILNEYKKVVTVTAERVTSSYSECNNLLKKFEKHPQESFPNFKSEDSRNSKRVGFGEKRFYSDSENTYYNLTCSGSYGPFVTLHYQIRGLSEDKELKKAWDIMFNR